MNRHSSPESSEEAEIIALKVLGFLASEPDRLHRFMDLSGLDVAAIRASAADPAFLGALLDHVLSDQTLLLIFAEENGLKPERIVQLRRKLPGAAIDF
ncbi:DUF3572 domain-containing protein [Aestuariivirga sp.]|uniref:DUF3572 domain-containing protein n=1 Tax=Aestuariivirga sp. TaxID=2650926 RepID=UPI0035941A5D